MSRPTKRASAGIGPERLQRLSPTANGRIAAYSQARAAAAVPKPRGIYRQARPFTFTARDESSSSLQRLPKGRRRVVMPVRWRGERRACGWHDAAPLAGRRVEVVMPAARRWATAPEPPSIT